MAESHGYLQEQFDDLEQQHEADWLGMWAFLATEVLMFGTLFASWAVYRNLYTAAFHLATHDLDLALGTLLTLVLLTSSFSMVLAVHGAKTGQRKQTVWYLLGAAFLGACFLGLEGWEYRNLFHEHKWPDASFAFAAPHWASAKLFFALYFTMTGLHMLHVTIGVCACCITALMAYQGRFPPKHPTAVEIVGLYWHFVDIVWVFLFPAYYLIGRS